MAVDNAVYEFGYGLARVFAERTRGGLDCIGHHQHRRLAALWVGARVREGSLVDFLAGVLAAVGDIEIFGHAGTMVFAYKAAYYLGQTGLVGKLQAVGHVVDYNGRATLGRQRVVRVDAVLIFCKECRVGQFANIVVESAGTHELHVGTYAHGGIAGEVAHSD